LIQAKQPPVKKNLTRYAVFYSDYGPSVAVRTNLQEVAIVEYHEAVDLRPNEECSKCVKYTQCSADTTTTCAAHVVWHKAFRRFMALRIKEGFLDGVRTINQGIAEELGILWRKARQLDLEGKEEEEKEDTETETETTGKRRRSMNVVSEEERESERESSGFDDETSSTSYSDSNSSDSGNQKQKKKPKIYNPKH